MVGNVRDIMQEQGDEYEINPWGFTVHRVGEVFIDNNHDGDLAHIVAKVDSDPFVHDEDAPSYQARCGVWGMSYSMGCRWLCARLLPGGQRTLIEK